MKSFKVILAHVFLAILAFIWIIPIVWVVLTSFKGTFIQCDIFPDYVFTGQL